ncbi:class I SAM-dependent methyltransferase [Ichthyenterobacterium magnum]|nr:class I SAM-dependent methyltransferase [Ichthyenterobacterium magnum]
MPNTTQTTINHNKLHYDAQYKAVNIKAILQILNHVDRYLKAATRSDISWVGMYANGFKERIKGKTILELGCGDCVNVAIMAALGAKVVANDISDRSGTIIAALNKSYPFKHNITFISGDFTKTNLEAQCFDFVIGKAFLHHLTLDLEFEILKLVSRVLKPDGEARFFETAVNSKVLDELRWAVPMNDRPSKWLQPKAFKAWEAADPHPPRDNSSRHYKNVGNRLFRSVDILPLGIFERFCRMLPVNKKHAGRFKRIALELEKVLPKGVRCFGARSQVVIYRNSRF